MIDWQTFASLWDWTSPAWLVAVAGALAFTVLFRDARGVRWLPLGIALVVYVLAFVSPIGVLANGYLFSAHMVQHLLLLLIVPMCLLLSFPKERVEAWCRRPGIGRVATLLSVPAVGWLCGLSAMWFWHVPTLCNASAESYSLGAFRDATFILAGLAFWWPIYSPLERVRLEPPQAVVYLFSACLGCTLLGIYITFTTVTVCPAFASPADRLGIMTMLHDAGLSSSADQQLGGLLMWVPPCSLYVAAIISVLCRWYTTMEPAPSRVTVSTGRSSVMIEERV